MVGLRWNGTTRPGLGLAILLLAPGACVADPANGAGTSTDEATTSMQENEVVDACRLECETLNRVSCSDEAELRRCVARCPRDTPAACTGLAIDYFECRSMLEVICRPDDTPILLGSDCDSLYYAYQECIDPPLPDGSECDKNGDCESGYCWLAPGDDVTTCQADCIETDGGGGTCDEMADCCNAYCDQYGACVWG